MTAARSGWQDAAQHAGARGGGGLRTLDAARAWLRLSGLCSVSTPISVVTRHDRRGVVTRGLLVACVDAVGMFAGRTGLPQVVLLGSARVFFARACRTMSPLKRVTRVC